MMAIANKLGVMSGNKEEAMYKAYYMAIVSKQPIDTIVDSVTTNLAAGAFQTSNSATEKPIRKIVFKNNIVGATNCFTGNRAIEELVFEGNVTVSSWAFQNMTALRVVRVGGLFTVVGACAFQNANPSLEVFIQNMTSTEFFTATNKNALANCVATAVFHMADGDFDRTGAPTAATAAANGGINV